MFRYCYQARALPGSFRFINLVLVATKFLNAQTDRIKLRRILSAVPDSSIRNVKSPEIRRSFKIYCSRISFVRIDGRVVRVTVRRFRHPYSFQLCSREQKQVDSYRDNKTNDYVQDKYIPEIGVNLIRNFE